LSLILRLPFGHIFTALIVSASASFEAVPAARAHDPPAQWAAESLALRPTVYSFAPPSSGPVPLDDAYRSMAKRIAEQRLVLAAARLAATLNGALCDATAH